MSRNLAVLTERGWVRAVDVSTTGRHLTVQITPAGTRTLAQARRAWSQAQTALTARLEPTAAATLDQWLAALTTDPAAGQA